jgi:hypothetical protein
MANKYLLKPVLKTVKEGFTLHDENDNLVYEGKMIKFSLFKAAPYEFKNYITNKTEQHKIGKTITTEESGMLEIFSTSSYFKYDGEKIWNYLHDKGIRINSSISGDKIGMTYEVSFEGTRIATISTSSPKGKSIITTDKFYDVTCEEKDLDLVFLVAFSIAKTNQTFYN